MKISCHSWAFNDMRLPEAIGTAARLGFRAVDIGSGPHLNLPRLVNPQTRTDAVKEIRADLALYHMQVADVYLLLPRISVDQDDKRRTDINMFKALLPVLKAIPAPGVTVSPGLIHPDEDSAAWERAVSALQEMTAAAQRVQLPISFEPHLDSMTTTPERALALVNAVDGLQITLDWAQLTCLKFKTKDIAPLLPHTRHVHLRQTTSGKLQTTFERGKLDIAEIIRELRAVNYDGYISVEYLISTGDARLPAVNPIRESITLRDAIKSELDLL